MKILISACLMGEPVRYDGSHNILSLGDLKSLKEEFGLIPFCPEMEGGLDTPRIPAEILDGRVINQNGEDVTKAFEKGAQKALEMCRKEGITAALLKSKSPSCGNNEIYDGKFSKNLINASGVTAGALLEAGISVFNEEEIDKLLEYLKQIKE